MSKDGVGVSLLLIAFSYLGDVCFVVVFSWCTNGCGVHPMSDFSVTVYDAWWPFLRVAKL